MALFASNVSQSLAVAEGSVEGIILSNLIDSTQAQLSVNQNPSIQIIASWLSPFIKVIQSPSTYTHEERTRIILIICL